MLRFILTLALFLVAAQAQTTPSPPAPVPSPSWTPATANATDVAGFNAGLIYSMAFAVPLGSALLARLKPM